MLKGILAYHKSICEEKNYSSKFLTKVKTQYDKRDKYDNHVSKVVIENPNNTSKNSSECMEDNSEFINYYSKMLFEKYIRKGPKSVMIMLNYIEYLISELKLYHKVFMI